MRELVAGVEARDVAALELEHALERGLEELVVLGLAGRHPRLLGVRGGAGDLGREVGGDVDRLVVVTSDRAVQRHSVRVRVGGRGPRLQRIEHAPEPGVGDARVEDPLERLELVRARVGPARRHHRVLVPQQQAADPVEIGDLAGAGAELVQLGGLCGHRPARA